VRAATEAVIELLRGADRERRRFLVVERAQADVIGAALAELDVARHQLDDVDAIQQVLLERFGNHRADIRKSGETHFPPLRIGAVNSAGAKPGWLCAIGETRQARRATPSPCPCPSRPPPRFGHRSRHRLLDLGTAHLLRQMHRETSISKFSTSARSLQAAFVLRDRFAAPSSSR
jgi:hypothetical protein